MCKVTRLIMALTAILFSTASVQAAPITFIHSGTASGSFLSEFGQVTTFGTTNFVITAQGDTDNIINWAPALPNLQSIRHDTASIFIDGVGTFDFVTQTETVASLSPNNQTLAAFSYSRSGTVGYDLVAGPTQNPASWDLLSSIGPLTGSGGPVQWDRAAVFVEGGTLGLLGGLGSVTFEAIVTTTVPAPGALVILGLGVLGLGLRRRL